MAARGVAASAYAGQTKEGNHQVSVYEKGEMFALGQKTALLKCNIICVLDVGTV